LQKEESDSIRRRGWRESNPRRMKEEDRSKTKTKQKLF